MQRSYLGAASTALLAISVVVLSFMYERDGAGDIDLKSLALVGACTLLMVSLVGAITLRPGFALALALAVVASLSAISIFKYAFQRQTLHALDIYFYVRPIELLFFMRHYYVYTGIGALALGIQLWLLSLIYRHSAPRKSRQGFVVTSMVAMLIVLMAYAWRGERTRLYHYYDRYHVSALFASAPEAIELMLRGGMLAHAAPRDTPPPAFQEPSGQQKPSIIVVLHESAFPTDLYPIACGNKPPTGLFTSGNGQRYSLRVETFGGATWLSEYGLMLGLSTHYFGSARNFLGYFMEGKIKDSLLHQLKALGYSTSVLYPAAENFFNSRAFYTSLGVDRFIELDKGIQRDRFYYQAALDALRTVTTSPQFLFLFTTATHSPYSTRFMPSDPIGASLCAKSPEWKEFLRRQLMAEADLAWFLRELREKRGDRSFLVVGFGDHQPFMAREFVEQDLTNTQNAMVVPTAHSPAYTTFFTVHGVNYAPPWEAIPPKIEIPFLAPTIIRAAGLQPGELWAYRDHLLTTCNGLYRSCANQDAILSFHGKLIEAHAISNR